MTKNLTGRGVLFWLLGFFGFIMAVNAWYITLSVKTFRGEDEQLPYLQGIAYNRTLALRQEQKALAWHANMAVMRLSPTTIRLRLDVRGADGRPVTGLALGGRLRHPVDENRDRTLALKPAAPGVYQVDLQDISPGAWDAVVHAGGGAPFEAERRLWVP